MRGKTTSPWRMCVGHAVASSMALALTLTVG